MSGRVDRAAARIPRSDREDDAAMTTRGSLVLRDIYKMMSVEFRTTMGELQRVALRSMIAKFKGLSKAERRRVWEAINEELASYEESDDEAS